MQQSTTRRTLHYYWQVTRKHKGLFWGLIVSTFLFVALLSYGNPFVMSLVVDRVSEGGVGPVSYTHLSQRRKRGRNVR